MTTALPRLVLLGTLLLCASIGIATAADGVPSFSVEPTCKAAARLETLDQKQLQSCLDDEKLARGEIEKEWTGFSAESRRMCYTETNLGGTPSYVEMLECLRLARDSKKYPAQ